MNVPRPHVREYLLGFIGGVGAATNRFFMGVGGSAQFAVICFYYGVKGLFRPRVYPRYELIRQIERTGAQSLPIMALIATLVGITVVAQAMPTAEQFQAKDILAGVTGVTLTRTLGPVLAAIVYTGRVGASFTAELGTMKVNDELLALQTMGIPPQAYLAAPRVMAGTFMLGFLILVFDLCALMAAYAAGVYYFDIPEDDFLQRTYQMVKMWDVSWGAIKAVIFGFFISVVACYKGFKVEGGGVEVGRATMHTVVDCILMIIATDLILTLLYNLLNSLRLFGK